MKILVCSKLSIPEAQRTIPVWDYAAYSGHAVVRVEMLTGLPDDYAPDVIISMGVGVMDATFAAIARWPQALLFCYNWDCYEWVWKNPRPGEYDYNRYGKLLKRAREVWVPSHCTGLRTKQWWDLDNWKVIRSSCPWWDYPRVKDEAFVLCTLRKIPDPHWEMLQKACNKLSIPLIMTQHKESYETYKQVVANCRFLVSHLYEASTGGLTLLEGYYHGKPCLISDSQWNGARDYLGNRAQYFESGNADSLEEKLLAMFWSPEQFLKPRDECRDYITDAFSDKRMVDSMLHRIEACR